MRNKKTLFITNINTLSALLDRLITERIKSFFFKQKKKNKLKNKQLIIIKQIKIEIKNTIKKILDENHYNYLSEQRTFKKDSNKLVKQIEDLIVQDLNIGKADNKLANSIRFNKKENLLKDIQLSRISLEKRANLKNEIDKTFKKLLEKK